MDKTENNGYIKLFRKSLRSDIFDDMVVWKVWCWCLMKASHKPMRTIIVGQVINLKEGQFVTGRFKAKKELYDVSISQFRRATLVLTQTERITVKTTNKFSIFTIVNWSFYQIDEAKTTNKRPTNDQQTTTYKNVKNVKKIPELRSELLINNKENMKTYNENDFSDSGEKIIDAESGEELKQVKTNATKTYWSLVDWAKERRGFGFMNIPKQFKAFSLAKRNSITPKEIKTRWEEFENDKFWISKGFDWMDVVSSFNKKR